MNTFIIFIVIFIIIFFVYYPLFNDNILEYKNNTNSDTSNDTYKQNLLNQIKELDFEKQMGTITDSEYKFSKNSLLLEISKLIEK
ncbi:MAG: hypothetical protein CMG07_05035 [Candidatus Marinimicrobia bacterium]|nr:hypothetical protein [Candidatus Neomarinimicrobiota bacterium]|tara:strand:- start:2142 stop:2396 length:255 start_codon:yes stop_codon:yes gene_type:complete